MHPIRLEDCCWSSSAIDIGSRVDGNSCVSHTERRAFSLALFPRSPYEGATNYSYNLELVLLLARYLRSHDVMPIHDCARPMFFRLRRRQVVSRRLALRCVALRRRHRAGD